MEKQHWIQELTTREVVGRVTDREYAARGVGRQPVTLYTIIDEERKTYRGATIGHQKTPDIGDRVEMYLEIGNIFAKDWRQIEKQNSDGTIEIIPTKITWEAIKDYRVLEDLL